MPFEMADKLQHENCNQESEKSNGTEQLSEDTCTDKSDKIFDIVQAMSKEQKEIFQAAEQRILKAQNIRQKVIIIGILLVPNLRLV